MKKKEKKFNSTMRLFQLSILDDKKHPKNTKATTDTSNVTRNIRKNTEGVENRKGEKKCSIIKQLKKTPHISSYLVSCHIRIYSSKVFHVFLYSHVFSDITNCIFHIFSYIWINFG